MKTFALMTVEEWLKTRPSPTVTPTPIPPHITTSSERTAIIIGIIILVAATAIVLFVLLKYVLPLVARYLGYLVKQFKRGLKE